MSARLRMAGIELRFVLRELEELLPLRVEKVYQMADSLFSFKLGGGARRSELIAWLGGALYLSGYDWVKPKTPSSLAMGLRKRLKGARIVEVEQLKLERVASLRYEGEYSGWVHVELFGRGNLVLTDEEGVIVQLARPLKVRARELKRGVRYEHPPSDSVDPSGVDVDALMREMAAHRDSELWRFLTFRIGIGPPYAEEVAFAAGADLRSKLGEQEGLWERIARASADLMARLSGPADPTLYKERDVYVDFSAFPLRVLAERYEAERVGGRLNAALDTYLTSRIVEEIARERGPAAPSEGLRKQMELKAKYEEEAARLRALADEIFTRLAEVESILVEARKGRPAEGVRLDRGRGVVIMRLSAGEAELDLRLSAAENASRLYERAKKLEHKAARIEEILKDLENRLSRPEPEYEVQVRRRKRRAWYERFRWFLSSGGMLVVAGLDASTNRELVRRYMEPSDLFFHVDMPGGAVVIVKTGGADVDEATLREAACYAASYSRAWKEGLSQADVFYVRGEQVSTHAPPGTFLPKGSFYIVGKRGYLRGELRLEIGLMERKGEYKLISRPPGAGGNLVLGYEIAPGDLPKERATTVLIESLRDAARKRGVPAEIEVEDLQRLLPSGGVRIVAPIS